MARGERYGVPAEAPSRPAFDPLRRRHLVGRGAHHLDLHHRVAEGRLQCTCRAHAVHMQCTRRAHAVRMQCACSAHRGDGTRHAQANLRHGARRTTSASIAQPPSEKRERTVPKSANGASCAARRRRSSSSAVSGSPPLPLPSQLSSSVASASATAAVPGWERKGSRVGAERRSEAKLKQSSSTGRPNSVRFDS